LTFDERVILQRVDCQQPSIETMSSKLNKIIGLFQILTWTVSVEVDFGTVSLGVEFRGVSLGVDFRKTLAGGIFLKLSKIP